MAVNRNDRNYEELYTELLGRGEMLHESNKRRIRRGIIILVILPVILEFIRWITDSDKVVFLIIWIFIMFVLSAYLISIEYLDYSVEKTLKDVTDIEADFDGLLPRPELRRGDLHERIRERFAELRERRNETEGATDVSAKLSDESSELEDAMEQLGDVREAEEAMEELKETAPAEIIAAMKEAFDADILRHEEASENAAADSDDSAGEEVPE